MDYGHDIKYKGSDQVKRVLPGTGSLSIMSKEIILCVDSQDS